MNNPLHPRHMRPEERRAEICRLLALGLIRLRARQSRELSAHAGEIPLHNPPGRSGHANLSRRRVA